MSDNFPEDADAAGLEMTFLKTTGLGNPDR